MDIIENWRLLSKRMQSEENQVIVELAKIHMGAFDDLRRMGHVLSIGGQKVSEKLTDMEVEERLQLASRVGQSLTNWDHGDFKELNFHFNLADSFPHCIFIHMAAVIENLDGSLNLLFPNTKMPVICNYDTIEGAGNPLGMLLPVLDKCYPWIRVVDKPVVQARPKPKDLGRLPIEASSVIFAAESVTAITVMRTAFSGKLVKGSIRVKDTLSVTDGSGNVLTREGQVMLLVVDQKPCDKVETGQIVDELVLSLEIPKGEYQGILLLDSVRKFPGKEHSNEKPAQQSKGFSFEDKNTREDLPPKTKRGFLSSLFRKNQ